MNKLAQEAHIITCTRDLYYTKVSIAAFVKPCKFTAEELRSKAEGLEQAEKNLAKALVKAEECQPVYPECAPPTGPARYEDSVS